MIDELCINNLGFIFIRRGALEATPIKMGSFRLFFPILIPAKQEKKPHCFTDEYFMISNWILRV